MPSIDIATPAGRDAALAILRSIGSAKESDEQKQVLTTTSDNPDVMAAVGDAFATSVKFAQDYGDAYKSIKEKSPGISKENAEHVSLSEAIMANRDAFPPEEFKISTDFSGGGSITSTIPSLKMVNAMMFAERNAEKEAQYLEADAAKVAGPDTETEALKAQDQALRTLLLDSSAAGTVLLVEDAKADEQTLAKPYLSDQQSKQDVAGEQDGSQASP